LDRNPIERRQVASRAARCLKIDVGMGVNIADALEGVANIEAEVLCVFLEHSEHRGGTHEGFARETSIRGDAAAVASGASRFRASRLASRVLVR
jgi:hypothetical protein